MGSIFSLVNIFWLSIIILNFQVDGSVIGLNYGLLGDNLPPPVQVISLVKSRNVSRIRLFSPDHNVLSSLQNSGVEVIVGTFDNDIQSLANDTNFAKNWVQTNIIPFSQTVTFRCVSVGNEVISNDLVSFVFPAIKNLNAALQYFNLSQIPVSTAIGIYLLASPSPPSNADFSSDVKQTMQEITGFLAGNGFPLLVTAYPYFSYVYDPSGIPISFMLLNSTDVVVRDGNLVYTNMFDAMVDAMYWALEKVEAGSVEVVICESGWPSKGNGDFTTIELAQTYNQNLVKHVLNSGTPKKPEKNVETYVFAIFNEDLKPPGVEQNFGLFYPNMNEVYHIDFN
ncbi:glucan endo-1,3-beta-glucosidase [Artemisia annua]|uniref:Glucan endo-1,3-beta-glucosidase n=1 Tax=Artemisia annua TaxID=35608 RepID=A0A2U1LDJ6_ARTAN|nr:glucan endo-1,3-beta-glucosidase [Artemisia annua]